MNQLQKVRSLLTGELPAILLTGAPNRQYATGALIEEGMCLVTADRCTYFTDSRYTETAERQLEGVAIVREVTAAQPYSSLIQSFLDEEGIARLGVEEEKLTHGAFLRLQGKLRAELIPCQRKVDGLRAAKEPWEQEIMRRAQAIADGVFSDLLSVIRPGMTEKELEAELIYRLYRAGAQGLSFPPIVVSGPNTSMPHGVAGHRVLREGDFVTMDFGVIYRGYCSDMTRTVALGSASEKMREVYGIVLRAQEAAISASRAGLTGREIDAAARDIITQAGFGEYFGHGYGHSLGIEIHESPNCSPGSETPMPVGAAASAEPGIYLPGEFGVRIEDVVIFGPEGCENITHSPKELLIL
ncbi:MAG: aminopeptidase P family protein [Oscillospiraceae bacterium]|nr:aminopeptidase P family protein [Oscillospiraceae bacterium]